MFNEKKEAGYVNWNKIEYKKSNIIENKKPILVLMNMNTCSGGESFVKALKTLKNTVFIGTNTSGMENIGNVNGYVLPNSKINVCFGCSLFIDRDLTWRGGLGNFPDFWVSPQYADQRVYKFIRNYSNTK